MKEMRSFLCIEDGLRRFWEGAIESNILNLCNRTIRPLFGKKS